MHTSFRQLSKWTKTTKTNFKSKQALIFTQGSNETTVPTDAQPLYAATVVVIDDAIKIIAQE